MKKVLLLIGIFVFCISSVSWSQSQLYFMGIVAIYKDGSAPNLHIFYTEDEQPGSTIILSSKEGCHGELGKSYIWYKKNDKEDKGKTSLVVKENDTYILREWDWKTHYISCFNLSEDTVFKIAK